MMRAVKDSLAAPYQASDKIGCAQLRINQATLAKGTDNGTLTAHPF
jgi:hypothetical protein